METLALATIFVLVACNAAVIRGHVVPSRVDSGDRLARFSILATATIAANVIGLLLHALSWVAVLRFSTTDLEQMNGRGAANLLWDDVTTVFAGSWIVLVASVPAIALLLRAQARLRLMERIR
jgi:hypothetical protein